MKLRRNHWILCSGIVALSAAFLAGACKPKIDLTETKDAGAIANSDIKGDVTRMACGPVPMAWAKPEEMLKRAYASLPPAMQAKDVAKALAAHYRLVDNPEDDKNCGPVFAAEAKKRRLDPTKLNRNACYLKDEESGEPVIVLKRDILKISENLIRQTVYAVAQHYVDRVLMPAIGQAGAPSNEAEAAIKAFAEQFVAHRAALANSIVDELSADPENKTAVQAAMGLFGVETVEKLKADPDYQNFVLAETIDTMYCAPQTATCAGDTKMCFKANGLGKTQELFEKQIKPFFGSAWWERVNVAQ